MKSRLIAILISEDLRRIGLHQIIRSEEDFGEWQVESFSSVDEFLRRGETYEVLYIESALLSLNEEGIRGRKEKIVPVISDIAIREIQNSDKDTLCTWWDQDQIRERVRDHLSQSQILKASTQDKGLSLREIDVLREVARGMTNKEIAEKLSISMNTVMTHRKNITAKLNIKTVPGLTFYALMNGLISGEAVARQASEPPLRS